VRYDALEIVVHRQQRQLVADAELGNHCIDGADVHT